MLPGYPSAEEIRTVLLDRADRLGRERGLSRSHISKSALGDNSFLTKVAAGGNFTLRSYERIMVWIEDRRHGVVQKVPERKLYRSQPAKVKPKRPKTSANMRNGRIGRKSKRKKQRAS